MKRSSSRLRYLLFVIFASISLVTNELCLGYAMAADFEGFDADEFEYDEDSNDAINSQSRNSIPPSATTLTQTPTAESHHGYSPLVKGEDLDAVNIEQDGKPHASSSIEFWDEEEFEGIPFQIADRIPDSPSSTLEPPEADEGAVGSSLLISRHPFSPSYYTIEIICISFIIVFTVNFFIGKRQNELIALCWASQFATKDSIFDKNFSLLGTGDGLEDAPLLLKEGQNVFKFYASGRRFCQGLLATMELRSRHDLIARLLDLLFNKKDTITFEVVMNEDSMDHVILAIARKKIAKSMHKECWDLQRFATVMTNATSGRRWVAEDLMVVTESKEVASDLFTDVVIDQVFGEKAFEKVGKGFISLHFSDQHRGTRKKLAFLKFALPEANKMTEMTRLINLVPYYIDLIGRYKLSAQARAKTEPARAKVAHEVFKEMQSVRQEELQKKKAEKKKLMEEAEVRLSAEAARKKEEKERSRQMKKLMPKVKMLRSH